MQRRREGPYQDQTTSATPNLLAAHRRFLPDDPVEHTLGAVGRSNRWWYLPGMYKPISRCSTCSRLGVEAPASLKATSAGKLLLHRMALATSKRLRAAAKAAGAKRPKAKAAARAEPQALPNAIDKTAEAYKVPIVLAVGEPLPEQCCTWPRYDGVAFVMGPHVSGESMLNLTLEELKALRVVELRTKRRAEKWSGPSGHYNWKKIGLSTAKFKDIRVCRENMPTARSKAAFDFLTRPDEVDEHGAILRYHGNRFYKEALAEQESRLGASKSLWISSFDLFINSKGIECAIECHVVCLELRNVSSARFSICSEAKELPSQAYLVSSGCVY